MLPLRICVLIEVLQECTSEILAQIIYYFDYFVYDTCLFEYLDSYLLYILYYLFIIIQLQIITF